MTESFDRREFFRIGTGLAAAAAMGSVARSARAQSSSVGYTAMIDGEVIEGRLFENVAVGVLVLANNVTIRNCRMRRLISTGDNGSGVEHRSYGVSRAFTHHRRSACARL